MDAVNELGHGKRETQSLPRDSDRRSRYTRRRRGVPEFATAIGLGILPAAEQCPAGAQRCAARGVEYPAGSPTAAAGHHRQSPAGVAQPRFLVAQPSVADEEARVWRYPCPDQRDPTATT